MRLWRLLAGWALPACLVVSALLVACGGGDSAGTGQPEAGDATAAEQIDGVPVVRIPTQWATANAADLDTLIASNGTVFVGRITELKEQRFDDPVGVGARAGLGAFPISLFSVKVERPVAGDLVEGSSVVVEQPGGVSTEADGRQSRLMLDGDEPLQVGNAYLLFATLGPNGNLTTAPFARFNVGRDGSLSSTRGWGQLGAAAQLSKLQVDDAAREIVDAASR